MKNMNLFLASLMCLGLSSFAEETKVEKIEAGTQRTVDRVKRSYRDVKDNVCEMINGKVVCYGKKMINSQKNVSDKVQSKIKEEKNKID